ncbi:MAG: phosphotransferase [Verrucomicrobiota bacterium]
MPEIALLREIAAAFSLERSPEESTLLPGGLIHETWRVAHPGQGAFVFQRFNEGVFPDPGAVQSNVSQIARHLPGYPLQFLQDKRGAIFYRASDGALWRVSPFLKEGEIRSVLRDGASATAAGAALGEFQARLLDFPSSQLSVTLSDFHDTPQRWQTLWRAHRLANHSLREQGAALLARLERHPSLVTQLQDQLTAGEVPLRVTHNDPKLSNLLFLQNEPEVLCLLDWDTLMPGYSVHDFGDFARSLVGAALREGSDPTSLYRAAEEGYRQNADFLFPCESRSLLLAAKTLAFELATRFLTDFLQGNAYFQVRYATENLERAGQQLEVLDFLESLH